MKVRFSIYILLALTLISLSFVKNQNNDQDGITIMAQDEDENKNNYVAPSNQKVISNQTNISYDEIDEEGYKKSDKVINNTHVVNNNEIKNLPSAQVILPIRRKETSYSLLNTPPCGGVAKKKADTLTNKGSNINVIWETINPVAGGNCTVKLSPGLENEQNFTLLKPVDISLDNRGTFPCGRVKGFESHQFYLPEDYVCDQCTLQWTWATPAGDLYSCSDIIINGNKIEDCLAKCKNGGACFNGKCLCVDGYYGDFCQYNGILIFVYKIDNQSNVLAWVILTLILLAVAGAAIYYFFFLNKNTFLIGQRPPIQKSFIEKKQDPIELSS